jgi:hypothetical protein
LEELRRKKEEKKEERNADGFYPNGFYPYFKWILSILQMDFIHTSNGFYPYIDFFI